MSASIDTWSLHDGDCNHGIDLAVHGVRKLGEVLEERG
jgi:hypothetical protein